jgi:hypothetical protein
MMNVNLNNRVFESNTAIMNAVADALEANDNVISANYDGECINVHEIDEDGNEDSIQWYLDTINYNSDMEGSVKSVNIDC